MIENKGYGLELDRTEVYGISRHKDNEGRIPAKANTTSR